MERLSLYIALWLACSIPCESKTFLHRARTSTGEHLSSQRGQLLLLSRSHLAGQLTQGAEAEQGADIAAPNCDCANCLGQRKVTDTPKEGFKGFQCKPRASGFKIRYCQQSGASSTWVIQSAPQLTYERFCYFTCKPVIPKNIEPDISCTQLTPAEAELGQTPSDNGRAFIWHSNPITDSSTLSSLDLATYQMPDAVLNLENAVKQTNTYNANAKANSDAAAAAAAVVAAKSETPPAPGFCLCRCPAPPTTTGPLKPYNPFQTPPPLPAAPPKAPGLPPPPPPPPVPPPPLPGPPPLPLLPLVLPAPMQGGPTAFPPPPPTLQPTPAPPATTTYNWFPLAEAITKSTEVVRTGQSSIPVESIDGFVPGRTVQITGPWPETVTLVAPNGTSALALAEPLKYDHPKDAPVIMNDYSSLPKTTEMPSNFNQPFPNRYPAEFVHAGPYVNDGTVNGPVGPFFPTYGPNGVPTTTYNPAAAAGALTTMPMWGAGPSPAGAFGMSTTYGAFGGAYGASPYGYGASTTRSPYSPYGTTPSPYGTTPSPYGTTANPYATTMRPYLLLDLGNAPAPAAFMQQQQLSPDNSVPVPQQQFIPQPPDAFMQQQQLSPDELMKQLLGSALPSLPPVAMPPAFVQMGMQEMGQEFRSAEPVDGCGCQCGKREAAIRQSQQNAMALAAFPEDEGQTVPWGQAAF